ncbi:TMEM43 family protein [Ensifer soli]|uniref:TMEM43 family protein n=1 Tax=Ciceribacter sp. sgz301302 TaxID=3342379 RepID=UPI0035B9E337
MVTETVRTSWFSRLKSGLVGLLVGPLLLVAMVWLLSWNEGRSVAVYRALAEGASLVTDVGAEAVDPANEGRLVHVSGRVTPGSVPADPMFGVGAEGAVGLSRHVEMFQWVEDSRSETRTTLGGGEETVTTYSYRRDWRSGAVDSSGFRQAGHDNPAFPVESARFTVPRAAVGAFSVDGAVLAAEAAPQPATLPGDIEARGRALFGGRQAIRDAGTLVIASRSLASPAIGDLRIGFTRLDIAEASLVGAQQGDAITAYRASNGRALLLAENGRVPAEAMFATARAENRLVTWLVRLGGVFGLFLAFAMALSILGIAADVVPFLGGIVRFGTSVLALVLALVVGGVVIALAWIAYRPLLALGILAAALAAAALVAALRRRKAAPAPVTFGRP